LSLKESEGETISEDDKTAPLDRNVCNKVAVVCIDPSSAVTGGSILGDKTRMVEVSRNERVRKCGRLFMFAAFLAEANGRLKDRHLLQAYVRPSPTKNVLGGLAAYTEDVVSLCQIAGFDLVILETGK
jgi:LAO/AO transport system kinase